MNFIILGWYLFKEKKLWTFPKVKTLVSKQLFWTKKTTKLFEKSMNIHVWPTYLLKNCPNFFPEKNMASTDPTYVWFDICPKFRSFFWKAFLSCFKKVYRRRTGFQAIYNAHPPIIQSCRYGIISTTYLVQSSISLWFAGMMALVTPALSQIIGALGSPFPGRSFLVLKR